MEGLASETAVPKTVMIDATYLKQPACVQKGVAGDQRGRLIGCTKGGMNTKLRAVADIDGRLIRFFMTACLVSD